MDLNLNLTKNPQNNDLIYLNEQQAIRTSLKNLILTKKGERIFQPYIGTNIEKLLFEIVSVDVADTIIEQIKILINLYEPRVSIDAIDVFEENEGIILSVFISYTIITNNIQDSFSTLLFRNR